MHLGSTPHASVKIDEYTADRSFGEMANKARTTCGTQSPRLWAPGDRIANVDVGPGRQRMQRPYARSC